MESRSTIGNKDLQRTEKREGTLWEIVSTQFKKRLKGRRRRKTDVDLFQETREHKREGERENDRERERETHKFLVYFPSTLI